MTDLAGMKVLIVDDTPANIDVLQRILREEGFEISITMNGEAALTLVEKNRPDLILLDVMMPGIDGFETCEKLKANPATRDIPVIFVTAKTEVEDIVRGFNIGSVDYIVKPYKREEVVSRVKTHLKIEQLIQAQETLNKKLQDQNNELIESQNQYRIILEKSSDGVFCLDAAGKIVSGNARFFSFLGFEVKELIGRSIMDIVNSEDPSGIYPKIVTRRFGDRATVNMKVQFCINENSPVWKERKYYSLLLDSYGIWNLPNNKIYDKGTVKTFMGAICLVKKP
ncbi:MAG: response regulator [Nitrospinae bacterium]|nr:response regulator [Nitrospinota bacterium]MBL7020824.1 response regulator [Nitrospinaceae bacterium]